jgi:hypothetical protein
MNLSNMNFDDSQPWHSLTFHPRAASTMTVHHLLAVLQVTVLLLPEGPAQLQVMIFAISFIVLYVPHFRLNTVKIGTQSEKQ